MLEIPWLRRIPSPDDVGEHLKRHPIGHGKGGLWFVANEPSPSSPGFFWELSVSEDGEHVLTSAFVDERGRLASLETVATEGTAWLPMTANGLPAFLFDAEPPLDPKGAPIVHVPTALAKRAVCSIDSMLVRDNPLADFEPHVTAIFDVIRERDHHAARVGELLQDGTWLAMRARAFASLLEHVRCAGCSWEGSPFAATVAPAGVLLCPKCGLPAIIDPRLNEHPKVVSRLFEELMIVVDQAQHALRRATVTGFDANGDPVTEVVEIPTAPTWAHASKVAEAIASITWANTQLGIAARRSAVIASLRAGDRERAQKLFDRYREDPGISELLTQHLGHVLTGEGEAIPPGSREGGVWTCCGAPVCVCGAGYLPAVVS